MGDDMKAPLALLAALVALGCGSALIGGQRLDALCGPRFDLAQDTAARRAYHDPGQDTGYDTGHPPALAEYLRNQKLFACQRK
jgi:hypothetical protein